MTPSDNIFAYSRLFIIQIISKKKRKKKKNDLIANNINMFPNDIILYTTTQHHHMLRPYFISSFHYFPVAHSHDHQPRTHGDQQRSRRLVHALSEGLKKSRVGSVGMVFFSKWNEKFSKWFGHFWIVVWKKCHDLSGFVAEHAWSNLYTRSFNDQNQKKKHACFLGGRSEEKKHVPKKKGPSQHTFQVESPARGPAKSSPRSWPLKMVNWCKLFDVLWYYDLIYCPSIVLPWKNIQYLNLCTFFS